ncbi:hypothetical protein OROMI_017110 [Orobanche minor]
MRSDIQRDYLYDEVSGRYYKSSGDLYDISSRLYWFATTKKWYFYNEEANTYNEFCDSANATEISMKSDMRLILQWGRYGFTIHCGLFSKETNVNASRTYFDPRKFENIVGMTLVKHLHEFWPSVRDANGQPKEPTEKDDFTFWQHEWDNHGRFSGLTMDVYFRRLVDIVRSFRRDVKFQLDTPYLVKDIISHIHSQFGVIVRIRALRVYDPTSFSYMYSMDDISIDFDVHLKMKDVKKKFGGDITSESDEVIFRHM